MFQKLFECTDRDAALNSAQNASSHASGAFDTAENEPKWVFLRDFLRKTVQWPIDIDRLMKINLHVCWKKRCFIEPIFISILNYGIGGCHQFFWSKSAKIEGLKFSFWLENAWFWSTLKLNEPLNFGVLMEDAFGLGPEERCRRSN